MPSGTLPVNGYLGDGQRTTGEFQGGIDELLAYVNSLKAEVDALSSQVIREAATRGVGNTAGLVPDKAVLDARLGTTGILGSAALVDTGTASGDVPLNSDLGAASLQSYQSAKVQLGGDYVAGDFGAVYVVRIGGVVTITSVNSYLDHTDGFAQPKSASLAIPSWARPSGGSVTNIYRSDAAGDYEVEINTSGELTTYKRERGGSLYIQRNTTVRPTICYSVGEA